MPRTTINKVNAALAAAGFPNVELVRGEDYFYFADVEGSDEFVCVALESPSVYTSHLNDLTVEQWVEEFLGKVKA